MVFVRSWFVKEKYKDKSKTNQRIKATEDDVRMPIYHKRLY
jgi:hypothetical protein